MEVILNILYFEQVQFHPRNDRLFLVCPMRHAAVLVDIDGEHKVVPLDDEVS